MPSRRATLKSLAKINLDLRVLHQRPDGFHELRTVFHTISLADTIDIEYEPARRTDISLDDPLGIPGNLVLKAAHAVLDALKIHARVHFRLRKNIPMGGGLGGGSSNAAAVLLALPVLAGRSVAVAEIAAELGSDVPFFLTGGAAVGIGRGTEVYELPELKPEPILLVLPGFHVATGTAYQALGRGLTANDSSSRINAFQAFVRVLASVPVSSKVEAIPCFNFALVGRGRLFCDGRSWWADLPGPSVALFLGSLMPQQQSLCRPQTAIDDSRCCTRATDRRPHGLIFVGDRRDAGQHRYPSLG